MLPRSACMEGLRTWRGKIRKILRAFGLARPRRLEILSNNEDTLIRAAIAHHRSRRWRNTRRRKLNVGRSPGHLLSTATRGEVGELAFTASTQAEEGLPNDEARSESSSLNSDDDRADGPGFMGLLVPLVKAERKRRKLVPAIDHLRGKLQGQYYHIESCRAELRHIQKCRVRRARKSSGAAKTDAADEFENKFRTVLVQRQRKVKGFLEELHEQEVQLQSAMSVMQQGEPIMFRAVRGFLRNMARFDPNGKVLDDELRWRFRNTADCGRDETNMEPVVERVNNEPMTERTAEGSVELSRWQGTAFRRATYRHRMAKFYTAVEPLLVAEKEIEPEDVGKEAAGYEAKPDNEDDAGVEGAKHSLLHNLQQARQERNAAQIELEVGVAAAYADAKELKVMAYDDDGELSSDEEEPAQESFDREHLSRLRRANRRVREADARWHELQNQALEQNAMDLNEPDLFGPADHASDGFTDSFCTSMCDKREQKAAMKKPRLAEWVKTAEGRGFRLPSEPSMIADIETGSSARSAISSLQNDTRPEVLERWKAEMVVVRQELEPRLREWEEFKQIEKSRLRDRAEELAERAAEAVTAGNDR